VQGLQVLQAFAATAQHFGLGAFELDFGVFPRGIDGLHGLATDAGLRQVDERQRRAGAALGQHDGDAGRLAVRDGHLRARQLVARHRSRNFRHRRTVRTFRDGQRADRLARDELRQPRLLLRIAAEAPDGLGGQAHGRCEGHRRTSTPDLFRDDAQFKHAEPDPAVGLRHRDAQRAQIGEP
jgi:hypothetical protein